MSLMDGKMEHLQRRTLGKRNNKKDPTRPLNVSTSWYDKASSFERAGGHSPHSYPVAACEAAQIKMKRESILHCGCN